jgi:hypothetical protein
MMAIQMMAVILGMKAAEKIVAGKVTTVMRTVGIVQRRRR